MRIYLYVALVVGFASCGRIYGLKNVRTVDKASIEKSDKKNGIHTSSILTAHFRDTLKILPVSDDLRKDMWQPLQLWVLTKNDVVCSIVNCDAMGFPNLKWRLPEVYARRTNYCRVGNRMQTAAVLRKLHHASFAAHDTCAVVVYSYCMGRQNKRFLRRCKALLKQHPGFNPLFINADNTLVSK